MPLVLPTGLLEFMVTWNDIDHSPTCDLINALCTHYPTPFSFVHLFIRSYLHNKVYTISNTREVVFTYCLCKNDAIDCRIEIKFVEL